MRNKKIINVFMVCILFLSTSTFAQFGKKMKQEYIDEYGTKTFNRSKEEIYPIIKEVLQNNGFEIELDRLEKGLIKTNKKVVGTTGNATHSEYSSSAQYRSNYRQYYVTINKESENEAKVVFKPKFFIGDADVSEKRIWVLNGNAGEIKIWERLFSEIEERL
jgi:hypothetical protein